MQTKNWYLRHQILGIPDPKDMTAFDRDYFQGEDGRMHWLGGAEAFSNLSVGAMSSLMELGFLDPKGETNGSPTAQDFLDFMKRHPMFTAIGYAIHPARADARITIEGMEARAELDGDTLREFAEFAETADEQEVRMTYCRCWWD